MVSKVSDSIVRREQRSPGTRTFLQVQAFLSDRFQRFPQAGADNFDLTRLSNKFLGQRE
jgi:hypothetical protein